MSKQSHTPGPWKTCEQSSGDIQIQVNLRTVAIVTPQLMHEYRANAHLIAAAPEMLEALEFILPALNANMDESEPEMQALLKAIGKARGES